jgi:hypothetical protein
MSKVIVYIGIVGLIIIAGVLAYNIYSTSLSSSVPAVQNTTPDTREINSPTKASTAPAVVYKTNQGIVSSVDSKTLVIKVDGQDQSYSIAATNDFQRILSGTFGGNNGKYADATRADVKVGQEVLLIVATGSHNVTTVFILK